MRLRTVQFWAIYNSATKRIIAMRKSKKALLTDWNISDSPWCYVVKMKGHYVRRVASRKASL